MICPLELSGQQSVLCSKWLVKLLIEGKMVSTVASQFLAFPEAPQKEKLDSKTKNPLIISATKLGNIFSKNNCMGSNYQQPQGLHVTSVCVRRKQREARKPISDGSGDKKRQSNHQIIHQRVQQAILKIAAEIGQYFDISNS